MGFLSFVYPAAMTVLDGRDPAFEHVNNAVCRWSFVVCRVLCDGRGEISEKLIEFLPR